MTSNGGDLSNRRHTRRSQAPTDVATSVVSKGKDKGNKAEKISTGRGGDQAHNEIEEMETLNEDLDELEAKIDENNFKITDVMDNSMIIFETIFELLPRSKLQEIAVKLQGAVGDDHIMLHDLVDKTLSKVGVVGTDQRQGVLLIGNPTVAEQGAPAAAAAATGAGPAVAAATYAAAAGAVAAAPTAGGAVAAAPTAGGAVAAAAAPTQATTRLTDQNYIDQRVNKKIEDINRKRNIIISGMVEEKDESDWNKVCRMLWTMGLDYLKRDIECMPTRLGAIRRDGKPRSLKVVLHTERAADEILNRKYDLVKDDNFYNVYINKDMTRDERDAEIAERKNKKNQKLANAAGGAGYVVGGGGGGVGRTAGNNNNNNNTATQRNQPNPTAQATASGNNNNQVRVQSTTDSQNNSSTGGNNINTGGDANSIEGPTDRAPTMNEARDLLGLPSQVGATALVSTNEVQSVPVADTPKRGANTGLVTRTITKLARSPFNPFGNKTRKEVGGGNKVLEGASGNGEGGGKQNHV